MWNNWKQLRFVAHSPLIVGMIIAPIFSLGTCIVLIRNVRVKLVCTKTLFNLSAEAIINVRNASLCARCAIFLLKNKQIPFLVVWPKGLHFGREFKINSRWYWRCLLSWQVLFKQREMRISWRLCNTSEIHLWLWKVWSLVVCSQSSFYVTRAHKDDKNRQNRLFLRWGNLAPNKQVLLNVLFKSTKYRKKELCVDNKVRETIGDVSCPTCRNEKCVYISSNKRQVSTTVKSAKPAATFWIFLLRTKNRQSCFLAVTVHVLFRNDESRLRERKAISIFEEISPPITSRHIRTWTKKGEVIPFMA